METATNISYIVTESFISKNLKEISDVKFKKEKKRIDFLKYIQRYLETSPSEVFLDSEKVRLCGLIKAKQARYNVWKADLAPKNVDPKKYKSIFNKEVGITMFNKQLKTINYLLS